MWGWAVIFVFYGLGMLLHQWGGIPLPGSLIGMLLLTFCLLVGWIPFRVVEAASRFLLKHMLLFFVPIIVGVASYIGVIKEQPWPILVALVTGPPLVMLTVGLIVQHGQARHGRRQDPPPAIGQRRGHDA